MVKCKYWQKTKWRDRIPSWDTGVDYNKRHDLIIMLKKLLFEFKLIDVWGKETANDYSFTFYL